MSLGLLNKLSVVAVLVACLTAAPALLPAAQHHVFFDRIPVDSGISQSIVTALCQDRQGFLWLGTRDGLRRYDGYEFEAYRFESDNPRSLSNNSVTSLLEDRRGRLWVGTVDGLNIFDRAAGSFRRYIPNPADPKSLSDKYVICLYEDRSGDIWIGTENGLNRVSTTDEMPVVSFIHYECSPEAGQKQTRLKIYSLLEDLSGRFWVGCLPHGLLTLDGKLNRLSRVSSFQENDPEDSIGLYCLFEDSRGGLWTGGDHGLQRLAVTSSSPPSAKFEQVYPRTTSPRVSARLIVYNIVEDSDGGLWVGTYGQGLLHIDMSSGDVESWLNDPKDPASLSNNYVLALRIDRTGTLWAGTSGGGLIKRNTTREQVRYYACSTPDPLASNRNMVFAILEDGPGRYLLGTRNGLCVLDSGGSSYRLWNDRRLPDLLKNEFIRFLRRDRGGRIWIGTVGQQSGLFRFDPSSSRFDQFLNQPGKPDSLGLNVLTSAALDPAGNLWIGTSNYGVDRVAAGDMGKPAPVFRHYRHSPAFPSSLSHDNVNVVFADSAGTIWVGTQGGGLNRLTASESMRDNPSFLVYKNVPGNPASLSEDNVISLVEDRAGRLWVGTSGAGLNLFDPVKDSFKRITEKDGLPDDKIYTIVEDGDGNIWVSTDAGLAKLDPKDLRITVYDTHDGLQGDEFNSGAGLCNSAEELLFGGVNGLNIIRPSDSNTASPAPVVAITHVSVAGREGNEIVPSGLRLPIMDAASIRLHFQNSGFKARFGILDYRAPQKNSLVCRIPEMKREWTLRNGEHSLDIPVLEAGRYTLEVLGVNADGVRSERPVTLFIEVARPYWRTTVFYLGIILLAASGGFALYIVSRKLKGARLLEELDLAPFVKQFGLSQREQELFVLLMRGLKSKDIAKKLFISENTVKVHIRNIYRKLGVTSRLAILELLKGR